MKIRPSILVFCVTILALMVLIVWLHKTPPSPATNPQQITTNQSVASPQAPVLNTSKPGDTNFTSVMKQYRQGQINKAQAMMEILSTENDIPINFYGRLVDQFDNGVADAQVGFTIQIYNGHEETTKRGQIESDDNGFFTILPGYKGQNLSVVPHKQGYVLAMASTLFWYSHLEPNYFRPDQNNPIVIKMWKLQGAELLAGINYHYKLHYTNSPINVDLLTGQIVSDGGDVQLTVNRASGNLSGRNRLDWSVQIAAVNGGIMDSGGQEEVTFEAPESGYQPSMTFMFSTNAPYKWFGGFDQGFFLKSRNGQVYSKLGLGFDINRGQDDFMSITFGGVANTNGSRNWEATAPQ